MSTAAGAGRSAPAGIGFKIGAALCMTLMMACVKGLSGTIPAGQIVFFRAVVTLVPVVIWLHSRGELTALCRPSSLRRHIGRGLSGSASMVGIFISLACLPLTDAVMLTYAAPLMTVLLARMVLRETVPTARWLTAVLGAVGVAIALSPHLGAAGPATSQSLRWLGMAAGLIGALCAAMSMIQIRQLAATEPARHIVFHYTLTTAWIGTASAVLGWVMPDGRQLALMLTAGVFSGLAQWLIARSLHHADAALTAPFDYTTLVWSVLIGLLVFNDPLDGATVIGGIVIIATAALSLRQAFR